MGIQKLGVREEGGQECLQVAGVSLYDRCEAAGSSRPSHAGHSIRQRVANSLVLLLKSD